MQWDDARLFLAFTRDGSFSAAAKRLGIQHSTISRRIHALEKVLGTPLLQRGANGYVLTDAGGQLKDSAERMEQEMLSFEAANTGQSDDPAGDIQVAAVANMASSVLMPFFASFYVAYPKIKLRIDVTNDSVRLAQRDADVALRQTNSPGDTLIGTRLTTVASAVYGSRDYCGAINNGERKENWIGVDCCDLHRTWTREASPEANQRLVVDDTSLTVAALKQGLGVAYLPCFLGDLDPDLVRFREPERQHDVGLWFLYHRDLRATKRISLFRDHMQREIATAASIFEGRIPNSSLLDQR